MFRSQLRKPRLWLTVWLLMILTVVVGSMMPAADIPLPMAHGMDKIVHAAGYFVLAGFAANIFRGKTLAVLLVGLVAMSGLIEFAQAALTATRSGDIMDFVANTCGVLGGCLISRTVASGWLAGIESVLFNRASR